MIRTGPNDQNRPSGVFGPCHLRTCLPEAPPDSSHFDMGPPHPLPRWTDRSMDPAPTGLDRKYASFALEGGVGGDAKSKKYFFKKMKKSNFRHRRKARLVKTLLLLIKYNFASFSNTNAQNRIENVHFAYKCTRFSTNLIALASEVGSRGDVNLGVNCCRKSAYLCEMSTLNNLNFGT